MKQVSEHRILQKASTFVLYIECHLQGPGWTSAVPATLPFSVPVALCHDATLCAATSPSPFPAGPLRPLLAVHNMPVPQDNLGQCSHVEEEVG